MILCVCVCVCVYLLKCVCVSVCLCVCVLKSMDQPGKVANPARSQLNRETFIFPVPVRA